MLPNIHVNKDRIKGPDYTYERFLNAVSHEQYKEMRRMGFCLERDFNMR